MPVITDLAGGKDAGTPIANIGKDPEMHSDPDLTRKVNEYEGQHRLAAGDPSQWGIAGGKDPEFPTTPG